MVELSRGVRPTETLIDITATSGGPYAVGVSIGGDSGCGAAAPGNPTKLLRSRIFARYDNGGARAVAANSNDDDLSLEVSGSVLTASAITAHAIFFDGTHHPTLTLSASTLHVLSTTDRSGRRVLLFPSEWDLQYCERENPAVQFLSMA